jgi:hypothetical protein
VDENLTGRGVVVKRRNRGEVGYININLRGG